ncbi:MAG: hypothetical protein M3Q89_10245, partial [Verrucomicrobiota bacterium]|nr:hypothetical protein [Verrucomicrobiota bacterium]
NRPALKPKHGYRGQSCRLHVDCSGSGGSSFAVHIDSESDAIIAGVSLPSDDSLVELVAGALS